MNDIFLLVSLAPLVVVPGVARLAKRSPASTAALDGFVAVAVAGITLIHIVPHAYVDAGWPAFLAVIVGVLLPVGVERWQRRSGGQRNARAGILLVAFLGLGFHAVLDGVALFAPRAEQQRLTRAVGDAEGRMLEPETAPAAPIPGHPGEHAPRQHARTSASLLALAVVLHRFPMALAIWWLARPTLGRRIAVGLLAVIGAATCLGFAVADQIWLALPAAGIGVLQALIAGMLLHIVGYSHHTALDPALRLRIAAAAGAALGLILVVWLSLLHPLDHLLLSFVLLGLFLTAVLLKKRHRLRHAGAASGRL